VEVATAKRRAKRRSESELTDPPLIGCPISTPTRSVGAIELGAKGRSVMRKVALDLGVRKIAYCEVANGEVVRRLTVSSVEALEPLLGRDAASATVAIEACREAWFVHETLTAWGNEVLLLDTTRTRQLGIGQHRRKNDRIDAEVLARAVERGSIPLAHLLSPHRRQLRNELGVRRALVETRAQYVTTVRGLMRERGIALPSCATESFVAHVRRQSLAPAARDLIEPLLTILELINTQLHTVEQHLAELSAQEPVVQLLTTAPGVGPIVAAMFVSVLDEAGRFRRAHQVEAYLGLVPSEHSTGGKQRLGSITRQGNTYLRGLLVQAGWAIVRKNDRSDPLLCWTQTLMERRGKKIAIIALARRLAGILWAMWRTNKAYDSARLGRATVRGLRLQASDIMRHANDVDARMRVTNSHISEVTAVHE
jgi:transposase